MLEVLEESRPVKCQQQDAGLHCNLPRRGAVCGQVEPFEGLACSERRRVRSELASDVADLRRKHVPQPLGPSNPLLTSVLKVQIKDVSGYLMGLAATWRVVHRKVVSG